MQSDSTLPPESSDLGSSAAAASPAQIQNFQFHGTGGEFFKIWIVNLLLSIVTLGIYSAWAKVRTYRYFYGNTELAGNNFEYHAEPLQILKGRVIAVLFLLAYTYSGVIHPTLGLLFLLAFIGLLPWVIVNGVRFNARMSSYRGIHFNFHGQYGQAAANFLLWPFLAIFTLFLLFPFVLWKQAKFYLANHSYGQSRFEFSGTAGDYYKAVGICLLVAILGYVAVFSLGSSLDFTAMLENDPEQPPSPNQIVAFMVAFYLPLFLPFLLYNGMAYNIALNKLKIKTNQFHSRLSVAQWAWIVLSNMVLIICTLGLFYPWARVRAANYKAMVTSVDTQDIDSFIADEQQHQSALGDEIGEAFDVGVGI